jgi:hypothetical protein
MGGLCSKQRSLITRPEDIGLVAKVGLRLAVLLDINADRLKIATVDSERMKGSCRSWLPASFTLAGEVHAGPGIHTSGGRRHRSGRTAATVTGPFRDTSVHSYFQRTVNLNASIAVIAFSFGLPQ